ncbi:MAG TPA: MFS transporter [Candidatus Limnocylindrales bacterium]|nr:MFS transporter [Candidatus Limnocylindrales bacterium]
MPLRARLGVFGIRDFSLYWTGGLLSNVGTWLQNIAASAFMYQLTGSPLMVGLLNFAGFLPILLFSLFGGVVSDRFDRRRVIVITHLASMSIALVVAALTFTEHVVPAVLIVAAFVSNTSYALAKPSLTSLLPALVPRDRLAEATGLNLLQFTGGQLGGSVLAAIIVATAGPAWAFLINAFTFLGPAVAVTLIRHVPPPDPKARKVSGIASIRDGFGYIRARNVLIGALLGTAATSALAETLRTLSPVLATEAFGRPESAAGFLVASWGAGSAVAIVATGFLVRRFSQWRVAGVGAALHGASAVALALAPTFLVGLGSAFLLGIGYSLAFTVFTARLQDESEDAYRGRVMSVHTLSHLGMRPFNALIAGALATALGVHLALIVLALLGPLALFAISVARRPSPVPTPRPAALAAPPGSPARSPASRRRPAGSCAVRSRATSASGSPASCGSRGRSRAGRP